MGSDEVNAAVSRRAVVMSSIGLLAGCSSSASTPTKRDIGSATETEAATATPTETETEDSGKVPFSETDRLDELVTLTENLGTTVDSVTTVANGVSLYYVREDPGSDVRNVVLAWTTIYRDVTGYSLFTATSLEGEDNRHGLFSINEELVAEVINDEIIAEQFLAKVFASYEPRWADE